MADQSQHGHLTVYRPEPSSRHPVILFLLGLCVASGLGVVLGAPAPQSIESQLDQIQVHIWGFSLAGGGAIYIIGLLLQSSLKVRLFTRGVALEQVGAASLGAAAILYSVAAMAAVGWSGAFPAGTTLAFGAACIYRWISILRGVRAFAREQTT